MREKKLVTSVRLDPQTRALLDKLYLDQTPLQLRPEGAAQARRFTKSQLLRHAITTGLDVLTAQEPLIL